MPDPTRYKKPAFKKTLSNKLLGLIIAGILFLAAAFVYTAPVYAANSPPRTGTITPSSGKSDPDQEVTFTTTFSDQDGVGDIRYVYFLVNTSITGANCFYGYYNQNINRLFLRNDTNTDWSSSYTPGLAKPDGSPNIHENTYGKLDCTNTTVLRSGNTLTINWRVIFNSPFAGTKNTYLYVRDNTGATNGWNKAGAWTITNQTPQTGTITPSSGSCNPDTEILFTATYKDPDGWQNLNYCYLLINTSTSSAGAVYCYYNQNTNKLYFYDPDHPKKWPEPVSPGTDKVLSAPFATLNCKNTTKAGSSDTLTITWAITFKQTFFGLKNIYLRVTDDGNAVNGWTKAGTITVNKETTPPTGTIQINNNSQYATSTAVTLNLSAQDNPGGSGIYRMRFSNDNVKWSTAESYAATKSWTLASGDGTKKVYAKFSDKAGNWSAIYSDTIVLDTILPTGTIKINNGAVYTNSTSVTLALSASDSRSGIDKMQFSNDNATWSTPETYATTKSWTLSSGDGTKTVYAKFSDKAGNWPLAVSDSIILDTVAPRVIPVANVIDSNKIEISYAEEVKDAFVPSNYSVTPFLGELNISGQGNNVYLITTTYNSTPHKLYKIVIQNITDLAGNPVDPAHNTVSFLGGSTGSILPITSMKGEAVFDGFGYSVSSAGDVNGDGYEDIVVGAPKNDENGPDTGKVYIYFGGEEMDNIPDITMTGEVVSDGFGYCVSSAGDVNGDGYDDVIVGIKGYEMRFFPLSQSMKASNQNQYKPSAVYIYYGGETMDNIADIILVGEGASDHFGRSVSSAGDVNGDGYDDVIVGAYGYDLNGYISGGYYAGKGYIYFGGKIMDDVVDVTMIGETEWDLFGYSVSSAGDVNGDGNDDIIVGAYGVDGNNNYSIGKVYIYFGSKTMDNIVDVTMMGSEGFDSLGYAVSSAGDVNGDGYSDIIIAAHRENEDNTGSDKAYVYFGGKTMDDTADVDITSEITTANMYPYDVSSAGDVNGDGFDDIIVGMVDSDMDTSYFSKAYIYYGGEEMDNIADITVIGEDSYDYFGESISSAGDVNGDGYDDVIVGAVGNDDNGSEAGKAYIFQWVGYMLDAGSTVDSFYVFDTDTQSQDYTDSRRVKVDMTESTPEGTIIHWLISESSQRPKKEDFVLTQRPTTYTITSNEGKVSIYGWVMNDKYQISKLTNNSCATIILDLTTPTGTISIKNDADYTSSRSVILCLSAYDFGSGVSKMCFSNDNQTYTEPQDYAPTKSWELTPGDGTKIAYVKFSDWAGNTSTAYSDTIILDTTAPTNPSVTGYNSISKTQTLTSDKWYNHTSPYFEWTAPSDSSGISGYYLYFGTNSTAEPTTFQTTTNYTASNLTSGQTYYLRLKTKDNAGNTSSTETKFIYKFDTDPPTGSISINSGATYTDSTAVTLDLTATDTASGIFQMQFSNDNTNWSTPETYATTKSWTLTSGDGTKTVYAKFKDVAGNWSSPVSDSIILDTTPPDIIITSPPDGFITNQTQITLKGTVDGVAFSETRQLTKEGENIITKTATDKAGNSSSKSITVIRDTIPPVIIIISPPDNYITNKSQLVVIYTVDGVRKEKGFTLSEGKNTITIEETDQAGNKGSASLTVTLDTIPPILKISSPIEGYIVTGG